ncbi:hypothetical protein BLNAU_15254 [Blattamonas nauphoetae]|uniref:Uncharacterized protein n=1 Tax=Blattamonas nauphoetae TaxID=2049346 RepID=A0ABQ9XEM2_9EUKA|nr:hypothetical protein BLNAU_15254 [Blattamonas nauphoetae]
MSMTESVCLSVSRLVAQNLLLNQPLVSIPSTTELSPLMDSLSTGHSNMLTQTLHFCLPPSHSIESFIFNGISLRSDAALDDPVDTETSCRFAASRSRRVPLSSFLFPLSEVVPPHTVLMKNLEFVLPLFSAHPQSIIAVMSARLFRIDCVSKSLGAGHTDSSLLLFHATLPSTAVIFVTHFHQQHIATRYSITQTICPISAETGVKCDSG